MLETTILTPFCGEVSANRSIPVRKTLILIDVK